MDYGLSSAISTCGDLFQSLRDGAPRWTAPELVENQVPSHAGDIYSFGCIAFHVYIHILFYSTTLTDAI